MLRLRHLSAKQKPATAARRRVPSPVAAAVVAAASAAGAAASVAGAAASVAAAAASVAGTFGGWLTTNHST